MKSPNFGKGKTMRIRERSCWYRPLITAALGLALTACSTTGRLAEGDDRPREAAVVLPSVPVEAVRSNAPLREAVVAREYPGFVLPAGLPMASADEDTMMAHFIDVGQGDAILLEFSCGAVLIDAGGEKTDRVLGRDRLSDYLEEFFGRRADLARTLNLVVLSHPHVDHNDGVQTLLNADPAIAILNVLDNGEKDPKGPGRSGQVALQRYVKDIEGVGYVGIAESDIKTVSGATNTIIDPIDCRHDGVGIDPEIAALWGRTEVDAVWARNTNNDSVVLRVGFGQATFLFLGDLEHHGLDAMLESYERDLSIFDVDVLKVGHHGSKDATTADFIRATTPKIAIIQAGDSSPDQEQFSAYAFGHPSQTAVQLLLDPNHGVSMDRPIEEVRIGIKGRNPITKAPPRFTKLQLGKAIYSNTWDGNIAVVAKSDGRLSVESEF